MKKPKIKVRELKPKMKIVSESTSKPEKTQDSLENVVDIDSDAPVIQTTASPSVTPTLTQKFEQQERKFESSARREEAEKEHFTYQMLNQQTTRRKYSSSIESQSSITADQAASSQRVDPSLPSAGPIRGLSTGQVSGDLRDALSQGGVEPGLRKFNQGEDREYEAEKSVQKYLARRRTEMM